ncbi:MULTISPECIES: immunity 17 family protein [unclassified Bacteroides]|uniref:immunity 17 family protein n=1 Tax=unclassified Bacteroides TaxID=2646097 RepID=UPI000E9D4D4D|nr:MULTISPECIES: immunity 17 family protein [unclassified Bacteroides]RGN44773.1 hypothetical protein DXB63_13525 [Bacteroides sp. OM05-12]RHR72728.1 hypothetical protein DWW69_15815 [Bacteroides sp. AF16-49]
MFAQYFVQILFALTGIISLLAALLDWEWFFSAQNAQFLTRSLGRKKTRLFYGVLGFVLMGTAVFLFYKR